MDSFPVTLRVCIYKHTYIHTHIHIHTQSEYTSYVYYILNTTYKHAGSYIVGCASVFCQNETKIKLLLTIISRNELDFLLIEDFFLFLN